MISQALAQQALKMESYGATCIYGGFRRGDEHERHSRPLPRPEGGAEVGDPPPGCMPTLIEPRGGELDRRSGREVIALTPAGRDGPRAGNAPLEVFIAAADKLGWQHGTISTP